MNFTVIDWFFSVIVVIFSIIGLSKGFIDNIFGKLAWILAIISSCLFYDDAANMVLSGMENNLLQKVLSFLMVFVFVFLIVKLVQVIVSKIFEWNILKSLDRTLGFFFGIIEGLVVVGLFIFLLSVQPFFSTEKLFENSFFYGLVNSIFISTKETSINV